MAPKIDRRRGAEPRAAFNPLQAAITAFASTLSRVQDEDTIDLSCIPKRYTRYGSLLVLGPTFLTHSPRWQNWYQSLPDAERKRLYEYIVHGFKGNVTHIAANAPIALTRDPAEEDSGDHNPSIENAMRSPTNFVPLHASDFEQAFWAEAVQLRSIFQIWAPRWTMFSRGNISEKARILQDDKKRHPFPGLTEVELNESIDTVDVMDFYVGIGYFAFCYLSRGTRRVWGWDINGWSIEGLRRGCLKNGWNIKVVQINEDGNFTDASGAYGLVHEVHAQHVAGNDIRCVAFWGDNKWVVKIMTEINEAFQMLGHSNALNVRHCNLGLLPTSQKSWSGAVSVLAPQGGWLHVHENAEISDIEGKRQDIAQNLQEQVLKLKTIPWAVSCEYVERVKTYAPGIMHCVFDIKIYPCSAL